MGEVSNNRIGLMSGQARRAVRIGHPELSVECPQCHAIVGRTCFMKPGIMGVTHNLRKLAYERQRIVLLTSPLNANLLR
jgi:hypothetical protein